MKEHTDALLGNSSRFEFPRRARVFDITLEPFRTSQNQMVGCVRLALDSTERKKSEAHMRHQATHDGSTGLFNYRAFCDALEREVVRSERSRGTFSLLLLDCE